jgi:CheY-like chemotaxis protein
MKKILLVDDMKNFLDLEVSFLQRKECGILLAHDGIEALRIAKKEVPDLIILDLEMPKMNGIQCCRIIKNEKDLKHIPVIFITGLDKEEECRKVGCDEFMRKPVSEAQFIEVIGRCLNIKERKESRANVSLSVKYTVKGKSYNCFSRDISQTGILLIIGEVLPIGTKLALEITFPGGREDKVVKLPGGPGIKGRLRGQRHGASVRETQERG